MDASDQVIAALPDKAVVVFFRSSFYGSGIATSVYESTGDATLFVGVIGSKMKMTHLVDPGHHQFMVIAENADFLEANLEAGKIYYVLISPRMGVWKARFSLLPIRNKDSDNERSVRNSNFAEWMRETRVVVKTSEADAWFEKNKSSILKKRTSYLAKWKVMLPEDKVNLTLNAEDGVVPKE